jgi:hypothetical protein
MQRFYLVSSITIKPAASGGAHLWRFSKPVRISWKRSGPAVTRRNDETWNPHLYQSGYRFFPAGVNLAGLWQFL